MFDPQDEAPLFDGIDRLKIVFVDGVFDAEASDDLSDGGGRDRASGRCGVEADIHWARDLYGVLETRGQTPGGAPAGRAEHRLCDRWRR